MIAIIMITNKTFVTKLLGSIQSAIHAVLCVDLNHSHLHPLFIIIEAILLGTYADDQQIAHLLQ